MDRAVGPVGNARDRTHRTRRTASHRNQVTAAHRAGRDNGATTIPTEGRSSVSTQQRESLEALDEHLRSAEAAGSARERSVTGRRRHNGASNAGRTPPRPAHCRSGAAPRHRAVPRRPPARRHAPAAPRRPDPGAGSRPATARPPPAPAVSAALAVRPDGRPQVLLRVSPGSARPSPDRRSHVALANRFTRVRGKSMTTDLPIVESGMNRREVARKPCVVGFEAVGRRKRNSGQSRYRLGLLFTRHCHFRCRERGGRLTRNAA